VDPNEKVWRSCVLRAGPLPAFVTVLFAPLVSFPRPWSPLRNRANTTLWGTQPNPNSVAQGWPPLLSRPPYLAIYIFDPMANSISKLWLYHRTRTGCCECSLHKDAAKCSSSACR
jgi:hypothetical protein